MTYSIVTKDGIKINNIPDDIPRDDPSLKAKVLEIRESREATTDSEGIDIPTSKNLNTSVGGQQMDLDIPTDENLAPEPQSKPKQLDQEIMKQILSTPGNMFDPYIGAGETLATLGTGAASTLYGTLGGILQEPFTGIDAEKFAESMQKKYTYSPRTAYGQQMTKDVANALGVLEGLPPYAPTPTKLGVRKPTRLGTGETGSLFDQVPSQKQLASTAGKLYDQAKKSGVEFKTESFKNKMLDIATKLRSEGYSPKMFDKLSVAFSEGAFSKFPRDFTEVQTIRKFFKNAAAEGGEEARLAMLALDEFDDYMINAPESHFAKQGKKGLEAWKSARTAYSRMKKSEMFEDLITMAERKSVQGGNLDRTLLNDLIALSKDKKRMKFFTPDEQTRILKLTKATNPRGMLQRVFSMAGLFAPGFGGKANQFKTGAYGFGAGAADDPFKVLGFAGGTLMSKMIAEQMQKGGIRDLARFSRAGGTEISPAGKGYKVVLPTGSEYYGAGGLLSNIIDEENR